MRDEVKKPVVAPASRSRRAAVWGLVIDYPRRARLLLLRRAVERRATAHNAPATGEGPVPVIAAAAKRADVPLYLEPSAPAARSTP